MNFLNLLNPFKPPKFNAMKKLVKFVLAAMFVKRVVDRFRKH